MLRLHIQPQSHLRYRQRAKARATETPSREYAELLIGHAVQSEGTQCTDLFITDFEAMPQKVLKSERVEFWYPGSSNRILGYIHSHVEGTDCSPSERDWAQTAGIAVVGICTFLPTKTGLRARTKFYAGSALLTVED